MNDMTRRVMMRDMARRGRGTRSSSRGDYDRHTPYMTSEEYARRGTDYASQNRYTPRGFDGRESGYGYDSNQYSQPDFERGYDQARGNRRYDGNMVYPFELMGRMGREFYPDYSSSGGLSQEELRNWEERLKGSLDERAKQMFDKVEIINKAHEMGITFDKFSKEEFYVTVLMQYTDLHKYVDNKTPETFIWYAKAWLCDDDIAVKYSDKLAAYYDYIVMGN